jgi:LPS export ABC transporter protein LptC
MVNLVYDPATVPSMNTDSSVTLISDSGITKYKLIAKNWKIFDKVPDPYWIYPDGIYMEQFDSVFNIEATVKADTAWNYTSKRLWLLRGNVYIQNRLGDEFRTPELYWNQDEGRFYSDKYIEVKKGLTETKGYGFETNQSMTAYKIYHPFEGKVPFSEGSAQPDSLLTDSIK